MADKDFLKEVGVRLDPHKWFYKEFIEAKNKDILSDYIYYNSKNRILDYAIIGGSTALFVDGAFRLYTLLSRGADLSQFIPSIVELTIGGVIFYRKTKSRYIKEINIEDVASDLVDKYVQD